MQKNPEKPKTHPQTQQNPHTTSKPFWETNYPASGNLIPNNSDDKALQRTTSME